MTSTSIENIPLSQLILWDGNVRKTAGAKEGIAELAASIKAHSLINPLAVRSKPGKTGMYEIAAGGRRFAALQLLARNGDIDADFPVRCHVHSGIDDNGFLEISLTENRARENMHPADEFEAFRKMADEGLPAIEIAARFGVTEKSVLQRLKLARVSPVILKAYRKGETNLDAVMAFAVTDDHKRQERVWKGCPDWQRTNERVIRDALTEGEIDATDSRVQFVTLKAYENAGGTTRRDLFAEGDEGIFITKPELLNQLVTEKLQTTKDELLKEGWKWVDVLGDDGYIIRNDCSMLRSEPGELPAKLEAEVKKLLAERKKLEAKADDRDTNDEERYSEIEDRLEEIEDERPDIFDPQQMVTAGVFVQLRNDGSLDIRRGYVKPEDKKAAKSAAPKSRGAADKPAEKAGLSNALVADLTAERTAAVGAVLALQPLRALQLIVHSLALQVFYDDIYGDPVRAKIEYTDHPIGFEDRCKSQGAAQLEKHFKNVKAKLPGQKKLLQWCLDADAKQLMEVLAVIAGHAVTNDCEQLVTILDVDMNEWFTPTADNYFGRVGKPDVLSAVKEATGKPVAPATEKLKKGDLAAFAERTVKGTDWLPKLLRIAPAKADKKTKKKAA